MGKKHWTPEYKRLAKKVREAAYANPHTRCQRCGRTLQQHEPHLNGKPVTWHAGHINPDSDELGPEASTCNVTAGARSQWHGQQPDNKTLNWYNPATRIYPK